MHGIIGTTWEHYRNGLHYMVFAAAVNPNTNERIIVYGIPGENAEHWRPRDEFIEKFSRVRD